MKYIFKIGIATHMDNGNGHSLCGISPQYTTKDKHKVDCLRCMDTKIYKDI